MRQSVVISIFIGALLAVTVFSVGFFYFQSTFVSLNNDADSAVADTATSIAVDDKDQDDEEPLESPSLPVIQTDTLSYNPEAEPVTVLADGDIMLGRYVETLMKQRGLDYPFTLTAADIRSAEIGR